MKKVQILICLLTAIVLCIACETKAPRDISVFYNGEILTMDNADTQVEAIAIEGDTILALGDLSDIENQLKSENLEKIDLDGNTLMPGIYDAHAHPVWGTMRELYEINFAWETPPEELKKQIEDYVSENNPEIILGGAWAGNYFQINPIESPVAWLDAISSTIPIILADFSHHNLWVNSAALQMAEIDRNTPDPENGKILKDANGEPNGILYENATFLVRNKIVHKREEYVGAIASAQKQALGFGIIGIKDANADESSLEVFSALDKEGKIDMFFALCQETPRLAGHTILDVNDYIKRAKANSTENIDANFVKFYLDGVPTTARTAALLCDYTTDELAPEATNGMLHVKPEILNQDVANFDKAGFTIKLHGAGDRSARVVIDAIEAARKANGMNGQTHELAHAEYIASSDIQRMKKFNIAADLSPYLWFPSPIIDNVESAVCDEMKGKFFEIKTLYSEGVECIAGSDWPAATRDMNPWIGIEAMVTRKNPFIETEVTYVPEERIPLVDVLRIFTINGAKALKRDKVSGSLEVGKNADYIILNKPILQIDSDDISDIQVLETFYKGKKKHSASGS